MASMHFPVRARRVRAKIGAYYSHYASPAKKPRSLADMAEMVMLEEPLSASKLSSSTAASSSLQERESAGKLSSIAFLKPRRDYPNLSFCSSCGISNRSCRWRYANGSGHSCFPCGGVHEGILEKFDQLKWPTLIVILKTFKGEKFILFYWSLDQALISYGKGKERHVWAVEDDLPRLDEPDESTLLVLQLSTEGNTSGVVMLSFEQYVKTFCTTCTNHLSRDGHQINITSARVLVSVPSMHIEMLVKEMGSRFKSFKAQSVRNDGGDDHEERLFAPRAKRSTVGRRGRQGLSGSKAARNDEDDEEEDDEAAATSKKRKHSRGNGTVKGHAKTALGRRDKLAQDFRALSDAKDIASFVRAGKSLSGTLDKVQFELQEMPSKNDEVLGLLKRCTRGKKDVTVMRSCSELYQAFVAEQDRTAFLDGLDDYGIAEEDGIIMPLIVAKERLYGMAEELVDDADYEACYNLLAMSALEGFWAHEDSHNLDTLALVGIQTDNFARLLLYIATKCAKKLDCFPQLIVEFSSAIAVEHDKTTLPAVCGLLAIQDGDARGPKDSQAVAGDGENEDIFDLDTDMLPPSQDMMSEAIPASESIQPVDPPLAQGGPVDAGTGEAPADANLQETLAPQVREELFILRDMCRMQNVDVSLLKKHLKYVQQCKGGVLEMVIDTLAFAQVQDKCDAIVASFSNMELFIEGLDEKRQVALKHNGEVDLAKDSLHDQSVLAGVDLDAVQKWMQTCWRDGDLVHNAVCLFHEVSTISVPLTHKPAFLVERIKEMSVDVVGGCMIVVVQLWRVVINSTAVPDLDTEIFQHGKAMARKLIKEWSHQVDNMTALSIDMSHITLSQAMQCTLAKAWLLSALELVSDAHFIMQWRPFAEEPMDKVIVESRQSHPINNAKSQCVKRVVWFRCCCASTFQICLLVFRGLIPNAGLMNPPSVQNSPNLSAC